MFATSPFITTTPAHFTYLPAIPSPLSPRSANIYGRRTAFMSDPEKKQQDGVPFSKRPVKKAPSPKQDELKETRRKIFLNKVKNDRDERRFEARGEDIMRLDWVQRRRQWEAELAREAPQLPSDPPEDEADINDDDYELPTSSSAMQISAPSTQQPRLDEEEVDEVWQREQQELEALLSYIPLSRKKQEDLSEHLYSDDDDYDALFSEFMDDTTEDHALLGPSQDEQGEAMDTS